MMNWLPVLLIN